MLDLDLWCRKSLSGIGSLWNPSEQSAWRHSVEKGRGTADYRPTVTFNALLAFEEYGLLGGAPLIPKTAAPQLDLPRLLSRCLRPKDQLNSSSHRTGARRIILLASVMSSLRVLLRHIPPTRNESVVRATATYTEEFLTALGSLPSDPSRIAQRLAEDPVFSPFLVLYARLFLEDRKAVLQSIKAKQSAPRVRALNQAFGMYFDSEVHRIMAHRQIKDDAAFDAPSLCFALRGLCLEEDSRVVEDPFFREAVASIVASQNPDGTWPDGVTTLVEENAVDTLQQPSVKIALTLSALVFRPALLVRASRAEMEVLQIAMPALEASARYLATTYVEQTRTGNASGWASDRVRWPRTSEAWITTLASRFLLSLHLARRAASRNDLLASFGARWPARGNDPPKARMSRWGKVIDPDRALQPIGVLTAEFVRPIIQEQIDGHTIVRPSRNGVAFILSGPPGSGKTYLVSELAAAVGWPLVELNPGTFIRDGVELIESRAREVFQSLMNLSHAVVFFDECDELFFDRAPASGAVPGTRNIMSFVTASMLPKLQQLHDERSVIFIVATNYLSRIDKAIRRPGRFDQILLLDRPDDVARRAILRAQWNAAPFPQDQVRSAGAATIGLTTKEIIDFASLKNPNADVTGSQQDYAEWTKTDGQSELEATRASADARASVLRRWKAVRDAVEE